jgi:4-oxalocrotonate tautomerase
VEVEKRNNMPHVIVKLWPGKSEEQKNRLAEEITKDVMASELWSGIGFRGPSGSRTTRLGEKVYRPDILAQAGHLYKEPGYTM